jgi:hypothetical protein
MLIADVRLGEPDLIAGHEWDDLRICDLRGKELMRIPAGAAWTVERLTAALARADVTNAIDDAFGADFYLSQEWIGSTEV